MPFLLYFLTAALLLLLAHKYVRTISRWSALLLLTLPLALTGEALLTNKVLAPIDLAYEHVPLNWMKQELGVERVSSGIHTDVYLEFVPWRKAAQWSMSRGEWGLWNPFTFAGEVLLASEQAAVTWPITWIALLLPPALSFTYTAVITLLIAALTMFLFARELGCREGASLIAAAGWTFSTSLVMFLLVAMSSVWAWAPLVLLGVRRVVREPSARAMLILAFAFTAILAGGHPESTLYVVMVGLLYGLFECRALKAALLALAAGALALLLSAIHLLPFLEAMPHTMEYAHRETVFSNETRGVPAQHVAARIATTFFPYLYARTLRLDEDAPPSHTTGAAGSIILAFAIYALIRRRTRETYFFAVVCALCLLLGAEWRPLANILARIPLFDIALGDRMTAAAALLLCTLAALGVEELCRRERDRAAAIVFTFVFVAIAAGNTWLLKTDWIQHGPMFFGDRVVLAEIALLAAATFFAPRALVPALLGCVVAQRALSVNDVYKPFAQRQAYPPIAILEPLKNVRAPFRIVGHGTAFPPATSAMYELEDIRGYSAMTFRRLSETFPLWAIEQPVWFVRVDDLARPFLSFLNVRYAITWDRGTPPEGWREIARQRGSVLMENTRALERAFVPRSVRVGRTMTVEELSRAKDFRERAWIETNDAVYDRTNGPGVAAMRGNDIEVRMQGDGWIVTSIAAWPGWRAYVDGKRVETQIANHAFLSVHVPAGRHKVRLMYWPRSFVIGRAITLLTLLALAAAVILSRRSGGGQAILPVPSDLRREENGQAGLPVLHPENRAPMRYIGPGVTHRASQSATSL